MPNSHDGRRAGLGDDGGRVSADDRDDLVPVDLQAVVEAHDDVVGEDAGGAL